MSEKISAPGFLGYFSFSWVNKPIFDAKKGKDLQIDNLYLPPNTFANPVFDKFQQEWDRQGKLQKKGKGRLLSVLLRIYGRQFFIGGIYKLLWSMFVIIGAFYFVRSLLDCINPKVPNYKESWAGWVLASGFFACSLAWSFCLQRMGYICTTSGIQVRSALITAVTRKAIFLSSVDVDTSSNIVGFIASDIGKVYEGMQELHYIWAAPLEAATILALLASMVKVWALPGVATVTFILLSQYAFGVKVASNKYKQSKFVHARTGIMQEILPAMKLVKYYGWEKFFEDKITGFRNEENKITFWNSFMKVINICMVFTTPPATALVVFGSYEFSVKRLNSSITFITLTLFNILRFPLVVLPKALRAASEAATSISKLEDFLLSDDEHQEKQHDKNGRGIAIRDGVFQYGDNGFQLNVPEFTCNPGEVVAVVGRVGAGKSALLHALLGNMQQKRGTCRIGGKIGYVPQTAWVQNLSIKDNIVFGNAFNEAKYREVIHSCALELDLQILPQGDQSMGGLRGMNLSGGQRQRVNIARSAYFDADTILLDNALSAVDHHTADHIFEHCIKGMFAEKAVILVTHQLNFMRRCDKVAIFDGGDLKYFGAFNPTAQNILANYLPIPSEDTAHTHEAEQKDKKKKTGAQASLSKPEPKPETKLEMGTSTKRYINAGPAWKFVCAVLCGVLSQSIRQMSDFWIRFWTSDEYGFYKQYGKTNGGKASEINVMSYAIFVAAFFWFQVMRSGFFYYWNYGASNTMHAKKLRRVLNTPLGFFLVKPVGELLNTFSSDQDKADESLPDVCHMALIYSLILLSTSVTVSINIPEFAAFAGVLLIITMIMLWLYLPAATQIKAMRLDTAGGLVGTTAEVLEGLTLIQAYNHEQYFVQEFTDRTDQHHRSFFNAESLNLWIQFYCDAYGAVMLYGVCLFAVANKDRGTAVVGLAFSNTIQLLVFYTWCLRLITEAISLSASVEQLTWLSHHTPVDGEDDINNEGKKLETGVSGKQLKTIVANREKEDKMCANWPQTGDIVFENVRMRYRPTAHCALNGVNLTIRHGEKVGIVGRTGSGKSTLLLALYRMFDLAEGKITVSGVDIHTLPLQKERRGLSIIPQEPFMFTGTLRENLDPLHQHKDTELLRMIDEVGLHEQANTCGGLDGYVAGSGSGAWSLGQMQLVCLVRAAINKVPIVCMDEATAALDPHTEKHVLEVAGKLFGDRTVLTIAHRLDAVIESDTVVVMEQGKVAETGAPHQLLSDPTSWFSKLIDMSGPAEAAILRASAAKHFSSMGVH